MATNIERLRAFVELMSAGRFDEGRAMLGEDVVIHEPDSIPYGGTFRGRAGFDEFRRRFAATWRSWADGPIWYAEHDGTVVKLNVIRAVSRATGRTLVSPLAEFFAFEGGQIVSITIFYQDTVAFRAAIDPAAGE